MKEQSAVFDQCRTTDDIHAQLQHRLKELLAAIQKTPGDSLCKTTGVSEHVNLRVLSELSYADLKQHKRPVFLLSEMCRLLFKLGNLESLKLGLDLSLNMASFRHDTTLA
jgi:hypothetical protein